LDESILNEWALACRRGDERQFGLLVGALSRTLLAMAYRYTRDWDWAQDLTQETWIRVHFRIRSYDPDRSFPTWLYAIHRNVCVDHLRRGWVQRERTPGERALHVLAGTGRDDPAARVEELEFRERLVAACDHLSPAQRRVFMRVDLDGEDQKTVAQDIGVSPGNLRTTLHFARRRIALALRTKEDES
jgi:RNA polymerase sigma-70 factor (ECF subfamily)